MNLKETVLHSNPLAHFEFQLNVVLKLFSTAAAAKQKVTFS